MTFLLYLFLGSCASLDFISCHRRWTPKTFERSISEECDHPADGVHVFFGRDSWCLIAERLLGFREGERNWGHVVSRGDASAVICSFLLAPPPPLFRIGEFLNQTRLIPHYCTWFFVLMYCKSVRQWLQRLAGEAPIAVSLFWEPSFVALFSLPGGGGLGKLLTPLPSPPPRFFLSITLTLSSNYPVPCF